MSRQVRKGLVPALRFPEFWDDGEWEERTLGNESTIVMGSSPKSEFYNEAKNGLPLLQGNADIKNRVSLPRIYTSQITKECLEGDILLSVRAPVGSVAKSMHHACIGRGIAAIRANKDNSQEFLYQWLLFFESQWHNISQGGTFDAVNSEDVRQLMAGIPSFPEQQKIADCLASIDSLITAQTQKRDALKAHKKGLMQQLFPAEGETQPKLRFPEFRNALEGGTPSSGYPIALGEVVKVASGQVDPTEPPYCDLPHIGGENIESHTGNLQGITTARELRLISGKYLFDERDVLYSKIRPALNKVALPYFTGICSADIYPLRPSNGRLCRQYLAYLLLSESFLEYAMRHSDRSKIPKLNRDSFLAYEVTIPTRLEQKKIADCLASLDALIAAQTETIAALKTHKKGLMQQLFPAMDEVVHE